MIEKEGGSEGRMEVQEGERRPGEGGERDQETLQG